MEGISRKDKMRNNDVLKRIQEKRCRPMICTIHGERQRGFDISSPLEISNSEGNVSGKRKGGRSTLGRDARYKLHNK